MFKHYFVVKLPCAGDALLTALYIFDRTPGWIAERAIKTSVTWHTTAKDGIEVFGFTRLLSED